MFTHDTMEVLRILLDAKDKVYYESHTGEKCACQILQHALDYVVNSAYSASNPA